MFLRISLKKSVVVMGILLAVSAVAGAVTLTNDGQEKIQLPILMYHSVLKDTKRTGKYIITPQSVEEDIKYMKAHGYTSVSASEVFDFVNDGKTLPSKPYLITFDDGCYNFLSYVVPLLEKYDAYAIMSIVGSYSGMYSVTGETSISYSYLRWEDIVKLLDTGRVEIANHSYDMHSVSGARIGSKKSSSENEADYIKKFYDDFITTQNLLEQNCGIKPVIYTYPFGAYSSESFPVLYNSGIQMTLTCNEGINVLSHNNADCLKLMYRFNRPGNMRTEDFFNKIGLN